MLTGKQKRYLRSLATKEKAIFQIGKDGLNNGFYEMVFDALIARELVKISVLKSCTTDLREISIEICAHCSCELVQTIGHTLVFYKRSTDNKIILP